MGRFTKEEKMILLTVVTAAFAGMLINLIFSYNNKIFTQPVRSAPLKVNINTAGAGEFQKIPGIGAVYAERIIKYREKNGSFSSPDEIKKVKGIGDKTFIKMKEFIVVDSESEIPDSK